ncbi:MAG: hypothetical protein KJT03_21155 [Verrucomicrobiae bacterium]|nr:hypothetical protein [Verrucomicrobiae bacterium]
MKTHSPPETQHPETELWAITCYFNPVGYQRRLKNYRIFRQTLNVPLVAVELSFEGQFHLKPGYADILIQLTAESVLWQKERLLNIALEQLPPTCRYVAWLDCDVTFDNKDWALQAQEALSRYPIIQPFSEVKEPLPNEVAQDDSEKRREGISLAYLMSKEQVPEDLLCGNMRVDYNCNSGLAWAARREILDTDGFYDTCIMGSGNRAMLCAAMGQPEIGIRSLRMTPSWAEHYTAWANRHYEHTGGEIGFVPGTLIHHWHGNLKNRRYQSRHEDFSTFDFNPARDIAMDPSGIWRWASDKPAMHRYAAQYFKDRKEDTL